VGTASKVATGLKTGAQATVVATGTPASASSLQDAQQFGGRSGAGQGEPGFGGTGGEVGEGAQGAPPAGEGGWSGGFAGGQQAEGPGAGS
jgi:hypothetical protein